MQGLTVRGDIWGSHTSGYLNPTTLSLRSPRDQYERARFVLIDSFCDRRVVKIGTAHMHWKEPNRTFSLREASSLEAEIEVISVPGERQPKHDNGRP